MPDQDRRDFLWFSFALLALVLLYLVTFGWHDLTTRLPRATALVMVHASPSATERLLMEA